MTSFSFPNRRSRAAKGAILALALVLASPLGTLSADARAGGGFSFGSRGTRTFSAPPSTVTAPRPAQPFGRTETANPGFNTFGQSAAVAQPRRFGFGSGLAAGLLGAGLFGMLSGNGFFGGLGGLASLVGLLFQVALIGGLIMLALRFFRRRAAGPVLAGFAPGAAAGPYSRTAMGGLGGSGPLPGAAPSGGREAVTIGPQDYTAFEHALVEVQNAYGREDMATLARLATPEMVRGFAAEFEGNRSRGVRNDVAGASLLQGDLAESWKEGRGDYATVAMRFTVRDTVVDRTSGRVVDGDPSRPIEATELWTFRRDAGGPWLLSAIQQTN